MTQYLKHGGVFPHKSRELSVAEYQVGEGEDCPNVGVLPDDKTIHLIFDNQTPRSLQEHCAIVIQETFESQTATDNLYSAVYSSIISFFKHHISTGALYKDITNDWQYTEVMQNKIIDIAEGKHPASEGTVDVAKGILLSRANQPKPEKLKDPETQKALNNYPNRWE